MSTVTIQNMEQWSHSIADLGMRIVELKLPAARPVDELRSNRYGECTRWSIFHWDSLFVVYYFQSEIQNPK
jgi:hypothetical protein